MKRLLLILTVTNLFNYAEACIGEAQIIAEAQAVRPLDANICLITINPLSVRLFNENRTCPLDINLILSNEIKIRTKSNGVCSVHPGSEISGVIIIDQDSSLSLE